VSVSKNSGNSSLLRTQHGAQKIYGFAGDCRSGSPLIDEIIAELLPRFDRATATLVVTQDPRERRFLLEAVVVAVLLFLIQRYCAGFLKGLGFDQMAEGHGRKATSLLTKIRSIRTQGDIASEKEETDRLVRELRKHPASELAKGSAERAVVENLVEAGATQEQAVSAAQQISESVASAK